MILSYHHMMIFVKYVSSGTWSPQAPLSSGSYTWPARSSQSSNKGCCLWQPIGQLTIINGLLRSSLRWWQHHHQNQNQRQNDWCHLVSLITAALIPLSGERLCKSNSKIILQTAQHCSHHNKNNNKQKTRIADCDLKMHLHGNERTVDSQKTVEHQEVAVHHKASISWQENVKCQGLSQGRHILADKCQISRLSGPSHNNQAAKYLEYMTLIS